MKRTAAFALVLSLLLCLCAGMAFADAPPEWTIYNTITVEINPEYADEILSDAVGAFDELDLKGTCITNKYEYEGKKSLHLILVLNQSGDLHQETAVTNLRADPRIKNVYKGCDAPYETVNTLKLTAKTDTIYAGETLTLTPAGTLRVYQKPFTDDDIMVGLKNYDPQKEYTLADFPHFDFASFEKTEYAAIGILYFHLKLKEPGYFNVCKAINALALDPDIESVQPNYIAHPAVVYPPLWETSDPAIADFVKEPAYYDNNGNPAYYKIKPNEKGEVLIKGLKPGKITVTYAPSLGSWVATDYAVTYDITVLAAKETPPPKDDPVPPTGASDIVNLSLCIMGLASLTLFVSRKAKRT